MKIISHPPDPAVEDARNFVDAAFEILDWDQFLAEIQILEVCEMLPIDLVRDIRSFLCITRRRLFWGINLSPVEYLQTVRVIEAICDVVDLIDTAHGPLGLEIIINNSV
jgi:hypothetical protein